MNQKITRFVMGTFVAVMVMIVAPASGFAKDNWHWSKDDHRWDRSTVRSDRRDLEEARQQRDYDASHHASRKKIAEDNQRVSDIERDLRADRRHRR